MTKKFSQISKISVKSRALSTIHFKTVYKVLHNVKHCSSYNNACKCSRKVFDTKKSFTISVGEKIFSIDNEVEKTFFL